MVTQRPLEALFLVRVQAGQPEPRYFRGVGLEIGNANVALGDAAGEPVDPEDDVDVGLGVGVGIIFSQWCSGTLAPPTSSTSFWQMLCSFSKSGGPNCASPVPGKIRYVTFRSLTGRL